jgi:hypothetical protein
VPYPAAIVPAASGTDPSAQGGVRTVHASARLAAAALAIGVALSACQGGLQIQVQRNGATVNGTLQEPSPLPAPPAVWNPNGDLTRMTVYWVSTACSSNPVLHLSGNALQLTIDPGKSQGTCSADLGPNFVTLRLNVVIDVTGVRVSMAGG